MEKTWLATSVGFPKGITFCLALWEAAVSSRPMFFACCRVAALASVYLWAVASAPGESHRPVLIKQNVDEGELVTLGGNTRPEANAKYDRGRVSDDFLMEHVLLLLRRSPEQEQELEQLIEELHDPSAPVFHHWLTAREFGKRFGVSEHDREAIKSWMKSRGLTINVDYTNHLLIDFSGTAGRIEEAFHTEIHNLNIKGERHIANMSDPKIPAALAPAVVGVVSLHDFPPHPMYRLLPDYTAAVNGTTYYLVTPGDLATIYNLNPLFSEGISGQGQTIAVIETSDVYATDDWTSFRSVFGLSPYTDGSFTQIHPAPPSGANNCSDPGIIAGVDLEAIVDAEYASAAAPSAAIVLASCADSETFGFGGLIALANLLNQNSTPPAIVSMSYGECEAVNGAASNAAFNSTFQQAVTEGVSVFVASGDHAAAACDVFDSAATYGIAISGFASSPYDVAVGGTDFGDTYAGTNSTYWSTANSPTYESAQSYIPEIPWNDSCASELLAEDFGYSQTYGTSGFCNSGMGQTDYLDTVGGGGGPSGCATGTRALAGVVSGTCAGWPKPSYQMVIGNPNDGVRDIPDVSLFAANGTWLHYYPVCFSTNVPCTEPPSEWLGAGGTSFSAPIMAGIQALVNQNAGSGQGDPNYVYYSLAAAQYGSSGDKACNSTLGNNAASSCIFYDVTQGDNDVDCVNTPNFGLFDCHLPSGNYGVLSTSNVDYQPAYAAATGWDFPTGIGTVNAYNLVTNWPTPFTLSASPSSLTIAQGGQSTSTITITPASGFSGNVLLSVSGLPSGVTSGFNPNPASDGSTLTLTVANSAPTGTVIVTVTGTSGSLTATTRISLTVTAEPSFTISASPSSLAIALSGQGTSTIIITPINGFSGNVMFSVSGLPNGVTSGISPNPATSSSPLTLTAAASATTGAFLVTVTGTSGSLTATATVNLTVVSYSSTTTLSSSLNPSVYGQAVSFTATVTAGATGTVQFYIDGSAFGLPVTLASGSATSGSISSLAAGTHAVTAAYSGDPNYLGSTGTLSGGQVVNLANATVNVAPSLSPSVYGQLVTFTATINGEYGLIRGRNALAAPWDVSGSVTWSPNTGCGTTAVTAGNPGTATCTTSALPIGTDTITATYSGDSNHSGGSGTLSQSVNQASTTTTLTSSLNPSVVDESVTFTATVTATAPASGIPTGTVGFYDGVTLLGSVSLTSAGQAVYVTAALALGSHSIGASYSGDTNFLGSSSTVLVQQVNAATTVTLSAMSLSFGDEALNFASALKTVTLTNSGSAVLMISNITPSASFAVSSTTCGSTLAVKKNCKVSLTFTPTSLGAQTGTLTFSDNAANNPQTVALSGTGIVDAMLTPASATYAKQAVDTTSPAKTFILTNNQPVALTSIAISTTGDFAVSATTCGTSLAAKGKCTISVTFTPTQTGTRTGQLSASDSASNSPQTSNLAGTGK